MINFTVNRMLCVSALVLCAAGLPACGGGGREMLSPDESSMQAQREQLALNRAMQANADALSQVKGERAGTNDTP